MENVTFFSVISAYQLKDVLKPFIFLFLAGATCFAQNAPVLSVQAVAAPVFQPVPPLCYGASSEHAIFYENFESGLGAWTVSNVSNGPVSGDHWLPRDWVVSSTVPARTGKAAFAVNPTREACSDFAWSAGAMRLTSPAITIPPAAQGTFLMAFEHFFDLESNTDGGNLKYQINNGDWKLLPASAFTDNGYIMNIMIDEFVVNPLFTQPVFTNPHRESTGSGWGQSRIDLSALGLKAGQTIRLRWEMGTDEGCKGRQGWYIDDVRVYTCAVAPSVQFALDSTIVSEREADIARPEPKVCIKYAEKTVTVKINAAPSQPVTITMTTAGTATRGSRDDYSITPASFTLEAGKPSQDVKVRINNDAYVEGNETITLGYTLSSASGGNAFRENYNQQHTVLIRDDDFTPGVRDTVLFSEGFNQYRLAFARPLGGPPLPPNWSRSPSEDSVHHWRINNNLWYYGLGDNTPFLWAYWDFWGEEGPIDTLEKAVESPVFDSFGMSTISLAYNEAFDPNAWNGRGYLDVWDGKQWHNVLTLTSQSGPGNPENSSYRRQISIPAAYASRSMKLRFRLKALYTGSWAIDNVLVTGTVTSEAAAAVTTDTQQLGPNATAYFYDPVSEKLIARIKNLTSHDYGCTAVSIDRAGAGQTDWFSPYHISNKTFKVTPSRDDPEGEYELTLYYTSAELAGLSKVGSMGRSRGGIGADNLPSTSVAEAVSSSELNQDFSYTAVFRNGFAGSCGFGLSDVPVVRPLTFRINCGGEDFTSSQDQLFIKDQNYDGISRTSAITGEIAGTLDDGLYRDQRWGQSFSYHIPVHNGSTEVVLHFAEIYWGVPGRGGAGGSDKRRFHVDIEGSRKLTDYNIFAEAGGASRARIESFTVDVSDGILDINFLSGAADNPIIAAIEVVSTHINVNPVADATVRNVPNDVVNYGTSSTLEVKAGSLPSYQRKTYLRFRLTGIPPVGSAKLRLYGSNIQDNTSVNMVAYGMDNDSWTETGITWVNAPAASGSILGSVNVNSSIKYYEIDVTSFVRSQASGDGTVSFLVVNPTNQNSRLSFNSRENTANPPELIIVPAAPTAARTGLPDKKVLADNAAPSVVYPNPSSGQLTVQISPNHQGAVDLQLTNLSGRSYPLGAFRERMVLQADLMQLHLPQGMYILNIRSAVWNEFFKLLITE